MSFSTKFATAIVLGLCVGSCAPITRAPRGESSVREDQGTGAECLHQTELSFGEKLESGKALCNGPYQAFLQPEDGNFVIYDTRMVGKEGGKHVAVRAVADFLSRMTGKLTPGSVLTMQRDCHLVLRAPDGGIVWASGTNTPDGTDKRCVAKIQKDGNFVIYEEANNKPLWWSKDISSNALASIGLTSERLAEIKTFLAKLDENDPKALRN